VWALLAGPLAQLQNLVLVDRGLTQGLRQLQIALKVAELTKKDSLPAALRAEIRSTAGGLALEGESASAIASGTEFVVCV